MSTFHEPPKNELEKQADELLSEFTKKRGSGLTRYTRSPGAEVLTDDLSIYGSQSATWDTYPSLEPNVLDENIRMRYLNQMMSKLTDRQRECMQLVVIQGMSERQAGDELGIKGGSVSKHLTAAKTKLAKMAEEDELFKTLFPGMVD